MPRSMFVGHEIYRDAAYGHHHPLAIPRVESAMDLCQALGWMVDEEFQISPRASEEQLTRFHTADYIRALQHACEVGQVAHEARQRHAIGTMENPLFPGLFERAATSVGGSIRAAQIALEGRIAFHPAGGTHHGRPDRASGFCYFNDPVFAILTLLAGGIERVLYVDLDAHHCDGVQDAFGHDTRVYTVSIHEQGRWPYTGGAADVGAGQARNLPVPPGFNDSELRLLVEGVVLPLARRMAPQAMVITCGADALEGDPLSSMALSNVALWAVVEQLARLAPATVVLGGGGYNPWTVARYWAGLWATLSGRTIPAGLPPVARSILAPLCCDLIDEEDIRPAWLTRLADDPNLGTVRRQIHELV
jgi:acetoin utilization protein AcuC